MKKLILITILLAPLFLKAQATIPQDSAKLIVWRSNAPFEANLTITKGIRFPFDTVKVWSNDASNPNKFIFLVHKRISGYPACGYFRIYHRYQGEVIATYDYFKPTEGIAMLKKFDH